MPCKISSLLLFEIVFARQLMVGCREYRLARGRAAAAYGMVLLRRGASGAGGAEASINIGGAQKCVKMTEIK